MSKKTTFKTMIALASALTLSVSISSYANNPLSGFFSGFWGSSKDAKSGSNTDRGSQGSGKGGLSSKSGSGSGSGSSGSASGSGSGGGSDSGSGSNNSSKGSSDSDSNANSTDNTASDSGSGSDSDNESSSNSGNNSGSDTNASMTGGNNGAFAPSTDSSGSGSTSSSDTNNSSGDSGSSSSSSGNNTSTASNSPFGGGPGSQYSNGISSGKLSGLSGLTNLTGGSSSASSLTIDELEAVSVSFVMYLNSTFYQLPYGYALAPQSIQSNLRLFDVSNQEDSENFDSSLNFSTITIVQSGSQIPFRVTSESGTGKTIDFGLTDSQGTSASNTLTLQENIDSSSTCDSGTTCLPRNVSAIAALFCNTSTSSTEGTACFNRMKNFSSIDSNVNNDPLLYALTSMPTSSAISGMKNSDEANLTQITLTNAQATTSSYDLPGTTNNPVNNNVLSFSNLFNTTSSSISTANYFVEFVTGAYTSNMALNPCFNNPGATMSAEIQSSASSGANSVNGTSSSSSSSAPTSPCDSGYNLSTDISALLLTDTSNSCTTSDPGTNCLLFQLQKSTAYKKFQLDLRTSVARKSILASNLQHLFQERTKQTYTNTTSTTGSLLIDAQPPCSVDNSCSAMDLQRFVANHRLQNLTASSNSRITWYDRLKTASPSLLAREQTLIMAEMLQLQERTYELTERILATNTVNASQNGRTFYNLFLNDISTLSKYAEQLQSSATSSSDSNSGSDNDGATDNSGSGSTNNSSSNNSSSNDNDSNSGSNSASDLASQFSSGGSSDSGSNSNSNSSSFGSGSSSGSNSSSSGGSTSSSVSNLLNG